MLLLLIAAILLLQIPAVQTGIAKRALASIQDKIDGKIQVGSLRIEPFNTIIVTDALLTDDNPVAGQDTVFYARISGKCSKEDLWEKKKMNLDRTGQTADVQIHDESMVFYWEECGDGCRTPGKCIKMKDLLK